jgi:hypothetical protein
MGRRRLFSTVFVTFAFSMALVGLARTQSSPDWQICSKGSELDNQIEACTRIIQTGRGTSEYLARAYVERGFSYISKGKNTFSKETADLGQQDFLQARKLNLNWGAPLLTADDKLFFLTTFGMRPESELLCHLNASEASNLHKSISAGNLQAAKEYFESISSRILAGIMNDERKSSCR